MKTTITHISIAALAAYRIFRLIAIEEGPFGLSQQLRNHADPDQKTWIGRGLACPWCISFWVSPIVLWLMRFRAGQLIVSGLAASAVVGLGHQCGGLAQSYAERLLRTRR